jgi:hypothetical protein
VSVIVLPASMVIVSSVLVVSVIVSAVSVMSALVSGIVSHCHQCHGFISGMVSAICKVELLVSILMV